MPKTNRRRTGGRGTEDGYKFNSTLPVWIIEDGKIKGTLHVQCPRCKGKAVISEKKWIDQPDVSQGPFLGRSCTYCFRTNRLPIKRMNKATRVAYSKVEKDD